MQLTEHDERHPPELGSSNCSGPQIMPSHIDTGPRHWYGSFSSHEREITAKLFVRACQKAGSWTVNQSQLDEQDGMGRFLFNGLNNSGLILDNRDGTYTASHQFKCICYGKFPAKQDV